MFKIITNLLNFILLSFTLALNSALVASADALVKSSINKKTTSPVVPNPKVITTPAKITAPTPANLPAPAKKTITTPIPVTPAPSKTVLNNPVAQTPINPKTPSSPTTPVTPAPKTPIAPTNPTSPTKTNLTTKKLMGDTPTGNTFQPADMFLASSILPNAENLLKKYPGYVAFHTEGANRNTDICQNCDMTADIESPIVQEYRYLLNTPIAQLWFDATSYGGNCELMFSANTLYDLTQDFIDAQIPLSFAPNYTQSGNSVLDPIFNPNTFSPVCMIAGLDSNYFTNVVNPPICFDAQTQFFSTSEFGLFLECQAGYLVGGGPPCYFGNNTQCCYGNSANDTCSYNNGALWSQLALLLSGAFPLASGTEFNSSNSAIFQPGIKLIESVCGTAPITSSSPCSLDILKITDTISDYQLFFDISNGSNWSVIAAQLNSGADINLQMNGLTLFMHVMLLNNSNSVLNESNILMYVSEIVKLSNFNPNIQDTQGLTALMYCFKATDVVNQENCVQLLTTYAAARNLNPNLQDDQGQTALMYAVSQPHDPSNFANDMVTQILTIPGIDVCLTDKNGHTALSYAQTNHNPQSTIEELTALQLPCDAANPNTTLATIQADITNGANVNATNNGLTALMYLAQSTNPNALTIIQYLLTIPDININLTDNQGHTAFWYAQNSLTTPAIRQEILKALDHDFNNILIYDIINYNSNTIANINFDIAAGASLTTPDSTGNSALMYAITNPGGANSTLVQAMEIFNTVIAAAANQNLIQKNSTNLQASNVIAPMTLPILIYTLQNGDAVYNNSSMSPGMLQVLLQNPNIDVAATDNNGENTLMYAAEANYTNNFTAGDALEIVNLLLTVPAVVNNINATDNGSATALDYANGYTYSSFNTDIVNAIQSAGGTSGT